MNSQGPEETEDDAIHDPTDPTGGRVVCRTRGEMAAMLEAAGIHRKAPKIIYMRKRRKSFREIAKACRMSHEGVAKIYRKLTRNLLRDCGLPVK